ncbi:hypothetical protein BDB00DRAFT_830207 [Zychaea mexicana]|uniref:uncharacterized protein n=1 Tax=Zychaea mexicana TaxID=64656 RepID=UPI0022FDF529|nr:uncharacterized protein BDB00DRAFT_830207 [Zychaea mexicana]KAI9492100.1 hypothetical protein BDB00DRAFT_830207 [Zychaea mexicana]
MLNKTRTVLHLRITQSTVIRVIVNIDQEKIDWYNESELHPLVLKALQPIIMEHLLSDKHSLSVEKRKKELEASRVLKHAKFRLAYRFMSKDHTHESMMLRDDGDYRAVQVYPYHLSIFVDEPRTDLSTWFAA